MMKKLREQMKWIMVIIAVAFLLSTFLMYEGRSTRRAPVRNADGTMADYEVAQVDGRPLMRSELERLLRATLESYNQRDLASLDMAAVYQSALDQYILESQLSQEISERGISVSDAAANAAMKAYADQYFPTREAFYQTLELSGTKPADFLKNVARQLAVQELYRTAIGDITVSEDEAVRFYDATKRMFYMEHPEGFDVYIASYNSSGDAEALRARLVSGDEWAVAISDDGLSSRDVVNVTQEPVFMPVSVLDSEMFAPLASLDVGQVSPVFSISSNDFTVALKARAVSESIRPYNDVSGDIRVMLREQEAQQKLADYQRELIEKAKVEIYDTALFQPASADAAPSSGDTAQ